MSVLYISYDGFMEQLGQSQVLPYLRELSRGRPITLITYEKSADLDDTDRRRRFTSIARDAGIRWIPLRYHKRPAGLSTLFDLAVGFAVAVWQRLLGRAQIVHARGYVPSVLGLGLKRFFGSRFIFDMRGFWVDQRVEMGVWRDGSRMLRVGRWFETRFLQQADVVFSLTAAAVDAMKGWPATQGREIQFEVVTTCTDLDLFVAPDTPRQRRPDERFTLGYVGNAGPGYVFDAALDLFVELKKIRPDARFVIVNRNDHAEIEAKMRQRALTFDDVDLTASEHRDVPGRMRAMDAAVFFVRPDPSRISSVPTRMGELLASGVPCVGNAGVADVVAVLEGEGVGVAVRDFSTASLAAAAAGILALADQPEVRRRCVEVARKRYSLADGVHTYERVYRQLEGRNA